MYVIGYFKTVTCDYRMEKKFKQAAKTHLFNTFNWDTQSYAKIIKYLYNKHTRHGYFRTKVIIENRSEIENGYIIESKEFRN